MSAVRVAHVLTNLGRGGPQGWVLRCAAAADPTRYEVDVIAGPGEPGDPTRRAEAEALLGHRLRVVDHLVRRPSPGHDAAAVALLARLFRARRYQVVHTHMTKPGLVGRLAAVLASVPVVVHTEHGLSLHHSENALARRAFDTCDRLGARWSDAVLFVSEADRKALRNDIGVPDHLLLDGRQGVDVAAATGPGREDARRRLDVVGAGPVYGTVTRLVVSKRVGDLVEAAALVRKRHPEARCIIVGGGPEEEKLRRLVARRGVGDVVTFRPTCDDVPAVLAAFDVFVHPSQFEGLPMVVMEALAAAVPVVAEDAGGTGEVVVDGVTGRLVSVADVVGLGGAINDLLDDPAGAARLAIQGRQLVRSRHDASRRAAAIEAVYDDLLADAAVRRAVGVIPSVVSTRRRAS